MLKVQELQVSLPWFLTYLPLMAFVAVNAIHDLVAKLAEKNSFLEELLDTTPAILSIYASFLYGCHVSKE